MTDNVVGELKELVMLRIDGLEKLVDERFHFQQKALELQSVETLRRLNDLNGSANQMRQMQTQYISREVYDVNHKELWKKIEDIEAYHNRSIWQQAIIAGLISTLVYIAVSLWRG